MAITPAQAQTHMDELKAIIRLAREKAWLIRTVIPDVPELLEISREIVAVDAKVGRAVSSVALHMDADWDGVDPETSVAFMAACGRSVPII
jgi:hypothetical protein